MIAILLGRELCSWFVLDEVPENRLAPLELPRPVARLDPVGDVHFITLPILSQQKCHDYEGNSGQESVSAYRHRKSSARSAN